ncbi:MAG TPA: prenyltransferase [Micromonosporaceae bacterium]|jgi:hypothetical protein
MTSLHSGLSQAAIEQTAAAIASVQLPSGAIPWFPGGQVDAWNHVEAAMALDVAGRHDQARAAYDWLRATQNPDGSWYRSYRGPGPQPDDRGRESNHAAYLAVGVLHHTLTTGDPAYLDRAWPTVAAAMEFVLRLQRSGGEITWEVDATGAPGTDALLTGCSSMFHSLRCALDLARRRDEPQPDWELAAAMLGHAVAAHPERFSPRERYSMDWYYPVLGGAVRGPAGAQRIDEGWATFVVPGLGVRCVSDRPWITGAETCELAVALAALGDRDRAITLFADMQHTRHDDGSYWTGFVFPDNVFWPAEHSTWTAAAVLLASAMFAGEPATTYVFGGAALPVGPDETSTACDACSDLRPA